MSRADNPRIDALRQFDSSKIAAPSPTKTVTSERRTKDIFDIIKAYVASLPPEDPRAVPDTLWTRDLQLYLQWKEGRAVATEVQSTIRTLSRKFLDENKPFSAQKPAKLKVVYEKVSKAHPVLKQYPKVWPVKVLLIAHLPDGWIEEKSKKLLERNKHNRAKKTVVDSALESESREEESEWGNSASDWESSQEEWAEENTLWVGTDFA
uniref:Uncharacterized protein n=1 Tax=Mycena chlorophos TaxID=658473 RepID=A0ABQ0L1E9_MYCCL|nr:predicted protein [Mycena chlorophos]